MRNVLIFSVAIVLAACSQGDDASESGDDFAARVGGGEGSVQGSVADPESTEAKASAVPAGADPLQLEKLGNIARVDLGQRDGGCTFSHEANELLIAGAPNDPAVMGKGVVRIGGDLINVTADEGGLDPIYAGPTMSAQGVTVKVVPAAGNQSTRTADLYVAADGQQRKFAGGQWACG
ncbi:hypothetical protein [Alteriqipengyuania sp.]|uniref:hypothetical protein n=1 Tax=Alteriqipengyuania sp. TaxID=2800692 RepID=UPI003517E666